MKSLKISNDLSLPLEAITEKQGFLGRTGQGKSYAAQREAELMLDIGAQIVALDPVGIWYGLRLAADGKSPGYPIPVFGGMHGDLPLEVGAGKLIADTIVDRNLSAVIDVSQFETDADKTRFATDFAARFFFRKKQKPSAVHIFLEEAQEFVPQNPQREEGRMLHAFTRLFKIGRNFGVGGSIISQRPQEVNKKVLNLTEILFVFQLTGPQERKTVEWWIAEHDIDEDIAAYLPKLKRGCPHVWSPALLNISKVVPISKKVTFDASSTPKVGANAESLRELAPIDLDKLRKDMAATVERAKAEDPKELQRQVAELKKQLGAKQKQVAGPVMAAIDGSIAAERREHVRLKKLAEELMKFIVKITADEALMKNGLDLDAVEKATRKVVAEIGKQMENRLESQRRLLEGYRRQGARMFKDMEAFLGEAKVPIEINLSKQEPIVARVVSAPMRERGGNGETPGLTPMDRAILTVLAQFAEEGCRAHKLVLLAGYTLNGSTRNSFSKLRTLGHIAGGNTDTMRITQDGIATLGDYEPLPLAGPELVDYWMRHRMLTPMDRAIFKTLLDNPDGMEAEPLCIAAGYTLNGSTRNCFSKLRTAGLIVGRNTETIKAVEELLNG
jgi:hypothetical protein